MSFSDIKGQDKPISILKGYIEHGRLEGGYLFSGPEGVGKKLVAKTLAQEVNCSGFDLHIIECGDAEIKIEYIRQLQKDISLRPYEGRVKVFIIDNAHNLTAEAANALLKILEEPPKDSLIILITDKPARLFKTIISRCKILKFSPLKRQELKEIFQQEYGFDRNLAHFLAYFSEGRLGRALRLKETDILNQKNEIIDKFALSRRTNLDNLSLKDKGQLRTYLNILAAWFRDIYLVKVGMPHQDLINFDRRNDLLKSMSKFTFLDLNEILKAISDSMLYIEQNINTKLLMYNLGQELWKG